MDVSYPEKKRHLGSVSPESGGLLRGDRRGGLGRFHDILELQSMQDGVHTYEGSNVQASILEREWEKD